MLCFNYLSVPVSLIVCACFNYLVLFVGLIVCLLVLSSDVGVRCWYLCLSVCVCLSVRVFVRVCV